MIQISTDFVFDGKQGSPYEPSHSCNPLSIYGKRKALGELAVRQHLKNSYGYILRTSWIYGAYGKNSMKTMLNLFWERDSVKVVSDQIGCPTNSRGLARACWKLIKNVESHRNSIPQLLHWSDSGVASWYDFAVEIADLATRFNLVDKTISIIPIKTSQYPTPAVRPAYSLLDCSETTHALQLMPIHWRHELSTILASLSKI